MEIYLEHNPFLVTSNILVDNQELPPDHELSEKLGNRMQYWVDSFFKDIIETFQANTLKVTFKGVQADCDDLIESAKRTQAEHNDLTIELHHEAVKSPEQRLSEIKSLVKEAAANGVLDLNNNTAFKAEYQQAIDPSFDVNVIATMSSGKSTVINSLLGQELLPAKNEATTATIARIHDKDGVKNFRAKRNEESGALLDDWKTIEQADLELWNSDPQTSEITIEGDILGIKEQEHASLVVVDTPGPNNSRNKAHEKTTIDMIRKSSMSLVFYVLNGLQLATNDDKNLLNSVREEIEKSGKQARDRFIFLVNKIDAFDPEKGQGPKSAVHLTRTYLAENGIHNPIVLPVSALLTLLNRKEKAEAQLTRKERGDLRNLTELFLEEPEMHLLQHMNVSPSVKRKAEALLEAASDEEQASIHAGIPVVELVVDEYLNKYAYPLKLNKVLEVVKRFIKPEISREQLTQDINQTSEQLKETNKAASQIRDKLKNTEHKDGFKAKLGDAQYDLLTQFAKRTRGPEKKFEKQKRLLSSELAQDDSTPAEAKQKIQQAVENAEYIRNDIVSELERVMKDTVTEQQEQCIQSYREFIEQLFDDLESTESDLTAAPIFNRLKVAASSISGTASFIDQATYQKDVVVATRTVSTSKWYNPFSWGDTTTINQYEKRDRVNLTKVWEEMEAVVSADFFDVVKSAKAQMRQSVEQTMEHFIKIMDNRLEVEIEKLLEELQKQTENEQALKDAQKAAKEKLKWLTDFERQFDAILSL